jgi:hypothetical protein
MQPGGTGLLQERSQRLDECSGPTLSKEVDVDQFRAEVVGTVEAPADRPDRSLADVDQDRQGGFNPEVVAACTPRQRRLLGNHAPAAYD